MPYWICFGFAKIISGILSCEDNCLVSNHKIQNNVVICSQTCPCDIFMDHYYEFERLKIGFIINTLRLRPNGCHFADGIFKYVLLYENQCSSIQISLKFVPNGAINSLWPGDAIWRHGTRSTLAQLMACCLTTPSHYLNQCWLIIGKAPWHSSQGIILRRCQDTNH